MIKEELEKQEKDLAQEEEKLVQEKKHLLALSEEYDMLSKATSALFEEVSSLFRESSSSDRAYYQSLANQHSEQQGRFQKELQDRLDDHAHRQRQLHQQQAELKERLRGKGEC